MKSLFVALFGFTIVTPCYPQFYTVVKKEKIAVIHSLNEDLTANRPSYSPARFSNGTPDTFTLAYLPSAKDSLTEVSSLPALAIDSLSAVLSMPNDSIPENLSTRFDSGSEEHVPFFKRIFKKKQKRATAFLPDSLPSDLRGNRLLCSPLDTLVVTSSFGYRTDPFSGKRKFHYGTDYRTSSENVYVMMPGKITKIGYNKVLGNYVTLEHGDFTVTYAHLHTVAGDKGQLVKAGQSIGISGSTGRSTGEHLHVAMRYRNKVIDPHPYVEYIAEAARLAQQQKKGE